MQPSLLFDQGGGAIPYSETLAPGQDVRITSVNAKWNGAAASGTFLACLSLYSQSGVLLSRSFPSQQFAAGDSGVVTYAPPLGASAAGAATATPEQGWASVINLPVLGLQSQTNNIDGSGAVTLAIDAGYPHNGYVRQTADSNYIIWPINLGPQGSWWLVSVLFANGPDYGKCELGIATAADAANIYGLPIDGGIASSSTVTFVTLQTRDCYAAVLDKFPTNTQVFKPFLIAGADGATGTAFTGAGTDIWNGGAGHYYLRLKTNGKNAASAGYKRDVSEIVLTRVSNDLLL